MKKISKQLYSAIEYKNAHPELSMTQVGALFGVERHSIAKHQSDYTLYCYEYNDEMYYMTDDEKRPVLEYLENESLTPTDITKKYRLKDTTLKRRMAVLGVEYTRRYSVKYNRQKFDLVSTEEGAYWLGFILADGYVNEDRGFLNIRLGAVDKQHLYKFAKFMELENPDKHIKECVGGAYTHDNLCYELTFNGRELVESLKKYNLFQGKSGKEIPYVFNDEKLDTAYIRGMIDGDGHIAPRGLKYVGSFESCAHIKEYFGKHGVIYADNCKYIHDYDKIKCLEIMNKEAKKVIFSIYDNASIYLDRKFDQAIAVSNKSE